MINSNRTIVMCGCHEAGWYLIRDLLQAGIRFSHFVTITPEQAVREKVSGYRDMTGLARDYNIPVYYAEKYSLQTERDLAFFREHKFDLLIQGGWQRLFPNEVLETLSIGAIGVHGSSDYLPKGRGRSPMNWSLIEGKQRFIMHLFIIKAGVDDGDVFDTEMFDINEFDSIRTLYYKYAIVIKRMTIRSVPKLLAGTATFLQQTGQPSYYAKRTAGDGLINWEEMDIWQLYNFIRAQTRPYPGAFGKLDGNMYRIWHAQVFDTRISYMGAIYGQIVERFDDAIVVNCRGGLLLITDYEPC